MARSASRSKAKEGARPGDGGRQSQRTKRRLLWVAGARALLALAALPLAPFLYRHHFLVLVLLRPSQGVLLAGAVLARDGRINLPVMLAAAIPLQLLIVWLYFLLGDAWQTEIDSDKKLPFVTARLLAPRQVRRLRRILRARGVRLVVLARFAIFPTGLLAATAGASDMERRRFFVADGLALLVATGLVVGAGYVLGIGQSHAGAWVIGVGVTGLVSMAAAMTFYVWRGKGE